MLDFEILISDSFGHRDLSVVYRPGPGEPRPDEATTQIDKAWGSHVHNCKRDRLPVFDGGLLRLNHYSRREDRTFMELGDTTFREYVGTSISTFYDTYPEKWVANPLAVCIALVTSDRKILIEKRTMLTRYRAPLHVIGGFMERTKDFSADSPDPFAAITREVKEELGLIITPEEPVALGLVRNLWIRHPEIVFFCRLREPFDMVKQVLATSVTDGEIDQLQAIEDTSDSISMFLRNHHELLTASGEACLLLYGRQEYGEAWYNGLLGALASR